MSRFVKAVPNYYKILNVPRNATTQEIKDAFYKLAKVSHPDVSKNHNDETFKQISEAYQVLKSPETKKEYDTQLSMQEHDEHASKRNSSSSSASGFSSWTNPKSEDAYSQSAQNNSFYDNPKDFADFKNQYQYYEYMRKENGNGTYNGDSSKFHKFNDKYHQYFTQKNVFDQKFSKETGNANETMEHRYDPQTNTHYYYYSKSSTKAGSKEEEYSNFYTMQGTYDSYEQSKNIPTVFGIKIEHLLMGIALFSLIYGWFQYNSSTKYQPYSNVYERRKSEEV